MTNSRTSIKEQFRDLLLAQTDPDDPNTAVTENALPINWEDRVYANRKKALPEGKLPALNVQNLHESGEVLNETNYSFARNMKVAVACLAAADDDVDSLLEEMADKVEKTIIGAFVQDAYTGINKITVASYDATIETGSTDIAAAVVVFNVQYDETFLPEVDDLEGFDVKLKVPGGDVIMESKIDIETE